MNVTPPPAAASQPVLEINDLTLRFAHTPSVVERVTLTLNRGETVALVGESGSGKSLTALSSLQLQPSQAEITGSVRLNGEELVGAPEKTLQRIRGNDISMIFQEPMTSLNPLHTIEKQIRESISLHQNVSGKNARAACMTLLEQVGLDNVAQRLSAYPHQLSGGQRQRVMIAIALANKPDVLIADEPTTALDVTIQAQILDLLKDIKTRMNMSMLFITHDLHIVRQIADRVYVMQNGKVVETGPTHTVFDTPQHPYTQKLLASEPTGRAVALDAGAPHILSGQNLKVWFPVKKGFFRKTVDYIKAVNDISFNVKSGETLGIVGESGSGKTTLGMALLRLISSKGNITFEGKNIQNYTSKQMRPLRKDLQVVFQDPYGALSPRMSVRQIIAEGLRVQSGLKTSDEQIATALQEVDLSPDTMHRYPHEFSGGQRQRIAIARALILNPKVIVLDEPTSALDMTVQSQVVDLLRNLQQHKKLTYIFISHDLRVVRALSHRVIVMKNGSIVEEGSVDQIFDAPQQSYTRDLIAAAGFNSMLQTTV